MEGTIIHHPKTLHICPELTLSLLDYKDRYYYILRLGWLYWTIDLQ